MADPRKHSVGWKDEIFQEQVVKPTLKKMKKQLKQTLRQMGAMQLTKEQLKGLKKTRVALKVPSVDELRVSLEICIPDMSPEEREAYEKYTRNERRSPSYHIASDFYS